MRFHQALILDTPMLELIVLLLLLGFIQKHETTSVCTLLLRDWRECPGVVMVLPQ
jgi:hypothetical protein